MAARTRLAQYLTDAISARGETTEQFAQRAGVNSSGLYKLLRGEYAQPRQGTIEKIAIALNMTAGELLRAADAEDEPDPIEAAIRTRIAEMREAVHGTPRQFWAAIIKATFDRAIDGARDMAQLLAEADSTADPPKFARHKSD